MKYMRLILGVLFFIISLDGFGWQEPMGTAFKIWGKYPDEKVIKTPAPKGWKEFKPSFNYNAPETNNAFILFEINPDFPPSPYYVPKTKLKKHRLKGFASHLEYEPIFLGIYAKKRINGLSAELSDLVNTQIPSSRISKSNIDIRWSFNLRTIHSYKNKLFKLSPVLLVKQKKINIPANQNRILCINIWIGKDIPAGKYQGKLQLKIAGEIKDEIPLTFKVLPIDLGKPIAVGQFWFGSVRCWHIYYPEHIPVQLEDMREGNVSSIAISRVDLAVRWKDGKVQIDWRDFPFLMDQLKKFKFEKIVFGADYFARWATNFAKIKQEYLKRSRPFPETMYISGAGGRILKNNDTKWAFEEIIKLMQEKIKENNWPELYYYVHQESTNIGEKLERLYFLTPCLHKVGAKAILVSNGPWSGIDEADKIGRYVDVLCYNYCDEKLHKKIMNWVARGKQYWYYNPQQQRISYGFWMKKIGAKCISQWVYQWGPPLYSHAGNGFYGWHYAFPSKSGPIPTIKWIVMREGLDDGRYINLLEQMIHRRQKSSQAQLAYEELQKIMNKIPLSTRKLKKFLKGTADSYKWTQLWRMIVAKQILKLGENK